MTAGLEAEHCAKCEKVVYEAEGLPAGNLSCSKKFAFTLVLNKDQLHFIAIQYIGIRNHLRYSQTRTN